MNAKLALTVVLVALVTTTLLRWTLISGTDEADAARLHGEEVFRLQNAVVSRLIETSESGQASSPRDSAALLAAEDRIVNDCRHLNEAASLSAGGGGPDLPLQMRVLASLDACEASALALRSWMDRDAAVLHVSLP